MKLLTLRSAMCLSLLCACQNSVVDDLDRDGYAYNVDCDDDNPAIHPGADELCDLVDNDCDGAIDNLALDAWAHYSDDDGDGFGTGQPDYACKPPNDRALNDRDCDDKDPSVHPGADELCDDVDRNCDGDLVADAIDTVMLYVDADGDGYPGTATGERACVATSGTWTAADDCDDGDPSVHPDADELCDDVDQDCDGGLGYEWLVGVNAKTLDEALNNAIDGDSVCLPPGDFSSSTNHGRVRLTLVGSGRGQTRVRPAKQRIFDLDGTQLTLRSLTLHRARSPQGGLIRADSAELNLIDVEVDDVKYIQDGAALGLAFDLLNSNTTMTRLYAHNFRIDTQDEVLGGFVRVDGGALVLDAVTLDDVQAQAGMLLGMFLISDASLTGTGLEASDLSLESKAARGGLIHAQHSRIELAGLTFRQSQVRRVHGAALFANSTKVSLSETTFEDIAIGEYSALVSVENRSGEPVHLSRMRVFDISIDAGRPVFWVRAPLGIDNAIFGGLLRRGPEPASPFYTAQILWEGAGLSAPYTLQMRNVSALDKDVPEIAGLISLRGGIAEIANVDFGPRYVSPVYMFPGIEGSLNIHDCNHQGGNDLVAGVLDTVTSARNHNFPDAGYLDTRRASPLSWDLRLKRFSPLRDVGDPALLDVDGSRSDIGAHGGPQGGDW